MGGDMMLWAGLAGLLLGFGTAIACVLLSKNFWIDADEQDERIRRDKDEGMRVNIKGFPEPPQ